MTFLTDSIDSARTQRDALRDGLRKRTQLIDSADFLDPSLDGLDRESLRAQAAAERALLDILNARILRFESNEANAQPQVLSAPGLVDAHTPQAANTIYAPERALTVDGENDDPNGTGVTGTQAKAALEANAVSAEADTAQGTTLTERADVDEVHALPEVHDLAETHPNEPAAPAA